MQDIEISRSLAGPVILESGSNHSSPRFNRRVYVLVLIAIVGGIVLFIPEALILQPVALELPAGYVGDILAWALLLVDMCVVGFVAYVFAFKRYVQGLDSKDERVH
jgi:hypothetical protein